MANTANGFPSPPQTEKTMSVSATPPRIILADKTARILCVADIRGDYHELNRLIREHNATAVIHTGDFGFLEAESLDRMGDKILRHLLQYSPLIPEGTRQQLLNIPTSAGRQALVNQLNNSFIHFPLSQFPHLLSGAITFPVPVFTVWGLIEDIRVLEKFRTREYEVFNLNVIDEHASRLLEVGGLKLRLFGLGGAVAPHKLFDNGEGYSSISGGQGTMWATALQIGELVDTAERVAAEEETRIFISSAPVAQFGLLDQTAIAVKADLTISAGLHFRYTSSYNAFSVYGDFEQYQHKMAVARRDFNDVYSLVKDKLETTMSADQKRLLKKAMRTCQTVPETPDQAGWTSTWHWSLADAGTGHMTLYINDGRISAETKSNGLHFGHRSSASQAPPNGHASNKFKETARRPEPVQAVTPTPKSGTVFARPAAAPALASIPPKPAPEAPTTAGAPFIKGVSNRPAQPPHGPKGAAPPTTTTNTGGVNSIPAKPISQPTRQPRGPGSAAPTPAPPAGKQDTKPTPASATAAAPAKGTQELKAPTPAAGNRKSPAPGQKGDRATAKPAAVDPKKDEAPAAPKTDKKAEETGPKADAESNAPSGPTQARSQEKRSLYLKKLPIPTSEEEIKALFPTRKDKITFIKLPFDHLKKQQREYAYVDFETEADAQEALKNHEDKIRDTTITVVVSNPPTASRFGPNETGGRGGRGGSRGLFRGGRGNGRSGSTGGPSRTESGTGGGGGDRPTGTADRRPPAAAAAKKD